MNTVVSLLSRYVAGILVAKLLFRGLRVTKARHLLAVGAGAWLLHKAFADPTPARPMELDELAAVEIDTIEGPWRTPPPAQWSGTLDGSAANGMT